MEYSLLNMLFVGYGILSLVALLLSISYLTHLFIKKIHRSQLLRSILFYISAFVLLTAIILSLGYQGIKFFDDNNTNNQNFDTIQLN